MDTFSKEWNEIYSNKQQICKWPFTDLVSLVSRNWNRLPDAPRVLEFGCGAGPNIDFFLSKQCDYHAIEGSQIIVSDLHKRYPELCHNIIAGDFITTRPKLVNYDLIFDRAAITHNTTNSIQRIIEKIYDLLSPGGLFIGVDWFSNKHSDHDKGDIVDGGTRTNIMEGQFQGIGNVHFFDRDEIKSLFHRFRFINLDEKIKTSYMEASNKVFSSWDFIVKRP